ncbi:MAG: TatD family hydrolase [Verrucomicrobiota bacterium]
MLTDTHAHLDYPDFDQDFPEVLRRAHEAGVTRIITIGTSLESSRRVVALAEKHPCIYAVIGVHPTSALEAEEDVVTPLRELAKSPRVVAIGETGLDYYRMPSEKLLASDKFEGTYTEALASNQLTVEGSIQDGAYKSAQAALFQEQLDLAVELGLNVVIHQRSAWDETLEILKPYTGKLRAVFHCFGNSFEQAQELIRLNHMVSFTGIITFKNAELVQETAAKIPGDSFMVETDCPYLAPIPFRGKRCEPAHTRVVAETIAKLRGESIGDLAALTTRNADEFFRFQGR